MNISKKLLQKLQNIQENKLTREVIVPLLESLGYYKVEFNGGVDEEGKDIIIWDRDRFGETKVYVAQVKHFKLSNKASGNDSLQTVVNQLENCIKKPILNTNKKGYIPSGTTLISSYPISTKTLKTRFSEHEVLKDHHIKIIDGSKLCQLLIENCPSLVDELLGLEFSIPDKIAQTLNNEILLKALGYNNKVSIKSIYTDVNFNLGKYTPKILIEEKYTPTIYEYEINLEEWREFKILHETLSKEYRIDFLNRKIEEVDLSADLTIYNKWQDSLKALEIHREKKQNLLKSARIELNEKRRLFESLEKEKRPVNDVELLDKKEQVDDADSKVSILEKELALANKKLNNVRTSKPAVLYKIVIDGHQLSKQIKEKQRLIIAEIQRINAKQNINIPDLKNFIRKSKIVIETTELIFNNPLLANCLKAKEDDSALEGQKEPPRLSIDIHRLFDTGLNFLVMGEAGAGKTTSLQMYAFKNSQDQGQIVFWISLSKMIQCKTGDQATNAAITLTDCIISYLNKLEISIDKDTLTALFKSKRTVLLLDGLDEAIKPAPWLPGEIKRFSAEYASNVQIIVSSRLSTKNISILEFFSITLMPFTNEQRDRFVKQWFTEVGDDTIYQRVKKHLLENSEVAEIVKNPLLTTTLCVLAENNLALPRTEINLYNNRINLLTGYYDNVKNLTSRITTTPHKLEILAAKIAFFLHSNNTREESIDNLIEVATRTMKNHLSKEQAIVGVQELTDPCNVLVPMSKDGQYGFGHLRYQEHLAAKEIINNRGIRIPPLLKNPWWKGVFIMFSKLSDEIGWLIQDLGKESAVNKNQEILFEMIYARPKHEHEGMESLLEKYIIAETDNI